jgi:hypothetical protein
MCAFMVCVSEEVYRQLCIAIHFTKNNIPARAAMM